VHGESRTRRPEVLAEEARAAAQGLAFAIADEASISERLAERTIVGQRAGRAVDVELGVAPRVAAVQNRQLDELIAVFVELLGERLEQVATLGEGQLCERGTPFSRACA
jgi:hypothetical protein